jgi:shikimate kinase
MTKDSIALIGFMATGKSTVGKALKSRLGKDYQFIETDQVVIEITGKSIPQIFEEDGEAKFREYEIEACKKVSQLSKSIISCGGGVVLNESNIEILKQSCHIVLLIATPEVIFSRVMNNGKENRPIINKKEPFKEIEKVLHYRANYYKSSADFVIETTDKSVEGIVDEILKKTKLIK